MPGFHYQTNLFLVFPLQLQPGFHEASGLEEGFALSLFGRVVSEYASQVGGDVNHDVGTNL